VGSNPTPSAQPRITLRSKGICSRARSGQFGFCGLSSAVPETAASNTGAPRQSTAPTASPGIRGICAADAAPYAEDQGQAMARRPGTRGTRGARPTPIPPGISRDSKPSCTMLPRNPILDTPAAPIDRSRAGNSLCPRLLRCGRWRQSAGRLGRLVIMRGRAAGRAPQRPEYVPAP
jgi:hypothetical protein